MTQSELTGMLGRWECINPDKNHYKYWTITPGSMPGLFNAEWGRIDCQPGGSAEYDEPKAIKKINEKMRKGYELKKGWHGEIKSTKVLKEKKGQAAKFLKELDKIG